MRLIYVIILGLIFFNVSLIVFNGFFPNPEDETPFSAKNLTSDTDYNRYANLNEPNFEGILITSGGIFAAVVGIGALLKGSIPTGQFLGAGMVISIVAGLWAGLTAPMATALSIYGGWQGNMIYNAIVMAIGIITIIGIAEIFTNKGDVY